MIKYILRLAGRIATYLLYLVTIVSAYGGYVPPKVWALPAILTLAFPYLLIASLVVAVAWLLGHRLFTAITGGVVVLICWPVATAACPVGFPSKTTEPSFSLMTYNVYQLQTFSRHGEGSSPSPTLHYLIDQHPDIICLQELSRLPRKGIRGEQSDSLRAIYPHIITGKPFQGDFTTFMLLSRFPACEVPVPEWMWVDCALYRVSLPDRQPLHILNVHLTSYQLTDKQRSVVSNIHGLRSAKKSLEMKKGIYGKLAFAFRERQHMTGLIRQLADSVPGDLIVCGDFNDVPGSYTYRRMRSDDLKDAVAETNFGPMITYNAHYFYFHIDQVLYRGKNLKAHRTVKGRLKSSDHYPLTVTFSY